MGTHTSCATESQGRTGPAHRVLEEDASPSSAIFRAGASLPRPPAALPPKDRRIKCVFLCCYTRHELVHILCCDRASRLQGRPSRAWLSSLSPSLRQPHHRPLTQGQERDLLRYTCSTWEDNPPFKLSASPRKS